MSPSEETQMRLEHAEHCLERAQAALRQGMAWLSACEADKAALALKSAIYEAEGASLIAQAIANERRERALHQSQ